MEEVELAHRDITPLAELVGADRWSHVQQFWNAARDKLSGQTIWHVNATATGGGVAEMLLALLPLWRTTGIETRWLVLHGEPTFFGTTKRLHNLLHGSPGDGGEMGEAERENYEQVLAGNLDHLRTLVQPGDLVVLHDPQTAGLIEGVKALGAHVIWRSHIGRDDANRHTEKGWAFLAPYLEHADRVVVSRLLYAPPSVPLDKLAVITPCIDPFTAKNMDIPADVVEKVLVQAGLLEGERNTDVEFPRRDGSTGKVRALDNAVSEGGPLPRDARAIVQVSRWDRLKDMAGVMKGFLDNVTDPDAHLVLCGPAVDGVSDDPEGAEVLAECRAIFNALDDAAKARVHLFSIPMDDTDENAYIINALQRHAYAVVQKSLFEGFGLTVTEAMWKSRPVIASAVGGIQNQIAHGIDGWLLPDPTDLNSLGAEINVLLADEGVAHRLGLAAREKVLRRFLGDGSMYAYAQLMQNMLSDR
ncbi:glycosyltransferase [Granulicoccus sp. GXG6511]|uniref:glycosyltransferase n=1 Tax=Granulicoccus sp. GXG6511 TaxID=3381351 RepID=UPI003D7D079E